MTNEDFWKMVNELLEDESDSMSQWEKDFVDDISKKNIRPTVKQKEKIEQIWDKIFG
jgi:hypothetical protein